jgi:hypothetical protein
LYLTRQYSTIPSVSALFQARNDSSDFSPLYSTHSSRSLRWQQERHLTVSPETIWLHHVYLRYRLSGLRPLSGILNKPIILETCSSSVPRWKLRCLPASSMRMEIHPLSRTLLSVQSTKWLSLHTTGYILDTKRTCRR